MSAHRIKLAEIQPNSNSFSHQQSVNQQLESKHKKKRSVYHKPQSSHQYVRLKTDEKEPLSIIKQQHYTPYINLVKSTNSASKLSKGKLKSSSNLQQKRTKKNSKHTISVINLVKNVDQSKMKGSSTITKRKKSTIDFNEKFKQKFQDFRIISSCLEEYVKEQKRNNNEINLLEIVKIIAAFNRSQIAPISKPLEKLVGQMMELIQFSISQPKLKSILKKSISFESPEKKHSEEQEEDEDGVKNTVKKGQSSKEFILKKEDYPGEVSKLQDNLGKLKYESNRLKYFLEEISEKGQQNIRKKKDEKSKLQKEKLQQLNELREIAKQQQKIIKQLQDSSSQGTYRSESPN